MAIIQEVLGISREESLHLSNQLEMSSSTVDTLPSVLAKFQDADEFPDTIEASALSLRDQGGVDSTMLTEDQDDEQVRKKIKLSKKTVEVQRLFPYDPKENVHGVGGSSRATDAKVVTEEILMSVRISVVLSPTMLTRF